MLLHDEDAIMMMFEPTSFDISELFITEDSEDFETESGEDLITEGN